jgi:hypothetical protein
MDRRQLLAARPGRNRHGEGGHFAIESLKAGIGGWEPGGVAKRIAVWIMYAVGALAIGYLGLYVYVTHSGRPLQPGKPIQIFRNPDAPSYS